MAFIIVLLHTRNPFDKFLATREGLGIALPFREPELNLFRLEIGDGVKIIIRFSFNLRSIHLAFSTLTKGATIARETSISIKRFNWKRIESGAGMEGGASVSRANLSKA